MSGVATMSETTLIALQTESRGLERLRHDGPEHDFVSASYMQPGRESIERFIASIFHVSYNAKILTFLPLLLGIKTDEQLVGALGLQAAERRELFVEQYLDQPIEAAIGHQFARDEIVELGNLASAKPGQGVLLYLLAVAALHRSGMPGLVFAANRAVRTSIRRIGFTAHPIAPAQAACLGDKARDWGSYYNGDPWVMLGDLDQTMTVARAQRRTRALLDQYDSVVERFAAAFAETSLA